MRISLAPGRGRHDARRVFIAWTTVARRDEAERLAADTIARGLAACVQIDGPVVSHYRWQGRAERAEEFRLTFKLPTDRLPALEAHVLAHHPYETPEWIVVRAEHVGEKYLSWAGANSTTPPL
ncbi:MAG TPA: divalent-cation tolerance protein CutA [Opitutus sp.]|nr:divalent-cation tolerance protein CutA [Opitutus sp.]